MPAQLIVFVRSIRENPPLDDRNKADMGLLALGINHKTATLELRERVAFTPERLLDALREGCAQGGVRELAILSTCNRTEFYCADPRVSGEGLVAWLGRHHQVPLADLSRFLYTFEDEQAVRHIMRVAAGLDSMVLGEPQILGQMKDAWGQAQQAGTLGPELDRLFQAVFACAKQVRSDTAIGANPVSVGFAAVMLARQIFTDLATKEALLIGAGEMIELVGKHLFEQGVGQITVANRTLSRGLALAEEFSGRAVTLDELPEALVRADIVISSTASPVPVVGKGTVERALRKRRHRPIFMVDIAVPRDIEPEVGELDDVYLYSVDDLQDVIAENIRSRQSAALEAERIVEARAAQFMAERRALDAVATLTAYREHTERLREQELEKALLQLQQGQNPEEVMQRLARNLANKLMHAPTVQLRQTAAEGRSDLLAYAARLLGVSSSDDGGKP